MEGKNMNIDWTQFNRAPYSSALSVVTLGENPPRSVSITWKR